MGTPHFPKDVIARKRDGAELGQGELEAFANGAADGSWADYQLSAMLMALFIRGMTPRETAFLTEAMMRSGSVADLSAVRLPKVDKHSTGGVGDKVSLLLAPMVAACGVAVPMISGRGLGHTGGTLDKLESIPGFRVGLSLAEFSAQVGRIGLALIGQTAEFAPADRKLYALRDVTGTVESIPLICASILSKKMASGAAFLVFDVKFGRGAFMRDKARARELAAALVAASVAMGRPARALMTAMDEPLGRTVGNALELEESIECLKGNGPGDVMEVTRALGVQMLLISGVERDAAAAADRLGRSLSSGDALAKFREVVAAQGGDPRVVDDPGLLPKAGVVKPLASPRAGFVQDVDARGVALAALRLGAGRVKAEDTIDPSVGVSRLVKVGERVAAGGALCMIHANSHGAMREAAEILGRSIAVGDAQPDAVPVVGELVG